MSEKKVLRTVDVGGIYYKVQKYIIQVAYSFPYVLPVVLNCTGTLNDFRTLQQIFCSALKYNLLCV